MANSCACGNPSCRGCFVDQNNNVNKCSTSSSCEPCGTNTPACESLSSQVTNFTKQFFGEVVKTELNGVISWSLPCSLDTGLENNPRNDGEGLACYFLRLFDEGIIGLTGPEGAVGTPGVNGRNSYTVTLASFVQPSLAAPNTQVVTSYNPAILEDTYVFIATSGWYIVNTNDVSGTMFLTFAEEAAGAPSAGTVISAGKLVVPSGFPGQGSQGPAGNPGAQGIQGTQGIQGPQGMPGVTTTSNNDSYYDAVGTDFILPAAFAPVDFTSSAPSFTLPEDGTYLITVVADILGLGGVATSDVAQLKLINDTTTLNIPGSEHQMSGLISGERNQIVISLAITTFSPNEIVTLYGRCASAGVISVVALRTTATYVQIS